MFVINVVAVFFKAHVVIAFFFLILHYFVGFFFPRATCSLLSSFCCKSKIMFVFFFFFYYSSEYYSHDILPLAFVMLNSKRYTTHILSLYDNVWYILLYISIEFYLRLGLFYYLKIIFQIDLTTYNFLVLLVIYNPSHIVFGLEDPSMKGQKVGCWLIITPPQATT